MAPPSAGHDGHEVPMGLQSRARRLSDRLIRWWRWWRLVLAAVTISLVAVAVTVDETVVAVIAIVAAAGPAMLLLGLVGSRTELTHRAAAGQGQELREARSRLEAVAADATVVGARVDSVARRLSSDIAVVVAAGPGGTAVAELAEQVASRVEGLSVVVIDRSKDSEVAAALVEVVDRVPGVAMVHSDPHSSVMKDVNDLVDADLAPTVVVVPRTAVAAGPGPVVELVRSLPAVPAPWIAARSVGGRRDVVAYRCTALREVGGFQDSVALDDDLVERFTAAGFACDRGLGPMGGRRTSPRVHDGRRRRLDTRAEHHDLEGAVTLMAQAAYHLEEVFPLAAELGARGIPTGIMVADRWWDAVRGHMHRSPVDAVAAPEPGAWMTRLRGLFTMNDWAREERALVDAANEYQLPTFAKIEGVQDFGDADVDRDRRAYRRARHILCQGANDVAAVEAIGGVHHVVGSSRLERIWARPPVDPGNELIVINLNFTWGVLEGAREEFLATALAACRHAGLEAVVSRHPAEKGDLDAGVAVSDEPISRLLARAGALVSRFSTVPFEAMAAGVPFVYHNPHGETVPTFGDPRGAFEITTSQTELAAALDDALTWRGSYRLRCEEFFRRQVDIDPDRTSAERSADVIVELTS